MNEYLWYITITGSRKGSQAGRQAMVFDDKLFNFTPRWIYKSDVHTYLSKQYSFISLPFRLHHQPFAKHCQIVFLSWKFILIYDQLPTTIWPRMCRLVTEYCFANRGLYLQTASAVNLYQSYLYYIVTTLLFLRATILPSFQRWLELSEGGNYWLRLNLWLQRFAA